MPHHLNIANSTVNHHHDHHQHHHRHRLRWGVSTVCFPSCSSSLTIVNLSPTTATVHKLHRIEICVEQAAVEPDKEESHFRYSCQTCTCRVFSLSNIYRSPDENNPEKKKSDPPIGPKFHGNSEGKFPFFSVFLFNPSVIVVFRMRSVKWARRLSRAMEALGVQVAVGKKQLLLQ